MFQEGTMMNGFPTVAELAKELKISEASLRRRVKAREVDAVKPGVEYFITPAGAAYAREKYGKEPEQ